MSVPVELDELRDQVAAFGDMPYALTVRPDGRPPAVCTRVRWGGDVPRLPAGRAAPPRGVAPRAGGGGAPPPRAAAPPARATPGPTPAVTLLWPPVEPGGYSLIVDGTGHAAGGADADGVVVQPAKAVLHR